MGKRVERDNIGAMELEEEVLYGLQTKRAFLNFPLAGNVVNQKLIEAIVLIKKAAILTYEELGMMESRKAKAILSACEEVLLGQHREAFVTQALQGGAGTSVHMNVNEVLANIALEKAGEQHGNYHIIHPLDDLNQGQSTNDVYPTALRIAAIKMVRQLSQVLARLQESLQKKEQEYAEVEKLGRTELMDAMPVTLGQEFGAYAQAISRDRWRIYKVEERLRQVNLGGTAVGTGSNANRKYTYKVIDILRELTDIGLAKAEYPMDMTQNQDVFVEVSGLLKALAATLMKMSTDLRWMNSGPYGGLGEIRLEPLQAGSTIMPGKVNPVIPEMMTQVAIKVMANDTAITICAASGNLELNAFMPLIADSLLESLTLLTNGISIFEEKCIRTLQAQEEKCREHLERSITAVTFLVPYIGYDQAAALAKECNGDIKKVKRILKERSLLSDEEIEKIMDVGMRNP
jgi:aspartate ammonia-lyase